jgi:hypothetical protein
MTRYEATELSIDPVTGLISGTCLCLTLAVPKLWGAAGFNRYLNGWDYHHNALLSAIDFRLRSQRSHSHQLEHSHSGAGSTFFGDNNRGPGCCYLFLCRQGWSQAHGLFVRRASAGPMLRRHSHDFRYLHPWSHGKPFPQTRDRWEQCGRHDKNKAALYRDRSEFRNRNQLE